MKRRRSNWLSARIATIVTVVLVASVMTWLNPSTNAAQTRPSDDCSEYTNWEWAQSIHDWRPSLRAGLDPDGNGIACEDLPRGGAAPAWWTDAIPEDVEVAMLFSITDGDTLKLVIDGGQEETLRLYRADTPELAGCGGETATEFVRDLLSQNDDGLTVWLESDATPRDRYDRRLAYVWLTIDGYPYMLNEALVRSGWARDVDYGDRLYADQMAMAARFASRWQTGQYTLCGGFDANSLAGSNASLIEMTLS